MGDTGSLAVRRLEVFLNPAAGRGSAERAWPAVEAELRRRGLDPRVRRTTGRDDLLAAVATAIGEGAVDLVAAGGDGTVQAVLDAVMAAPAAIRGRLRVGALGLGTSNDLHKPLAAAPRVGPVPGRIEVAAAAAHDLIRLDLELPDGRHEVRHGLQSSSVGTIPTANLKLTGGKGWSATLYRLHYRLALWTTSAWVVMTYPGFEAEVAAEAETFKGRYSGLTVLKRAPIAGDFVFATQRRFDDGRFDLGLCEKVDGLTLMGLIGKFEKQGFAGHPQVTFRELSTLVAKFAAPEPVEIDGEVTVARSARWEIVPKAVTLLA